jgi:hypothetical protein
MTHTKLNMPSFAIKPQGEASLTFIEHNLTDFKLAAFYVRSVPYGRITKLDNLGLVLKENRGTCSTKHGLLAQVAKEQGQPFKLMLGIYEMNEANTTGVGSVLNPNGLDTIPEAHCYLSYNNNYYDFTRRESPIEPQLEFIHEEEITPEQISEYKTQRHKFFMEEWLKSKDNFMNLEMLWKLREDCITHISSHR